MPKNIPRMGYLFCSLSMAGSLLHGRPCFCAGLALWQQREGIRRIFDTPFHLVIRPRYINRAVLAL